MKRLAICLIISASAAFGQEPETSITFKSTTNLVIVNVAVKDASDHPLENLKPQDFELLEDGKPQTIAVFEYQRLELGEPAREAPATTESSVRFSEKRSDITPSEPGQVRYRDRRLLVLFFDFSSMAPAEQIRAQKAALKFLDQHMSGSDLVAVMSFSNRLQVLQDFTDDRDLLRGVINGFFIGEASELAAEADTSEETAIDTGAAFVADDSEFNIFNTDRKLSALETAAKMLSSLPEKKALVYFASGVGKTGVENHSQLRATINAALRGNVAFYPVDARGLVAEAPSGNATQGSPRGSRNYSGAAQRQRRERFNDQQETLFTLAADTGGKALLDSNDLALGITQAQKDISSYYILGYYSTNPAMDGRFRRVRVRIPSQPKAKLDYRSGYFAPKQFKSYTSADKERQLEEALLLGDPITDLTLALEVNYFRLARDRYFAPVAVKIPGSEVDLARKSGHEETAFDFIGQVRDGTGNLVGAVRDRIKVKLQGADAERLDHRQLQYDSGFTLTPGEYSLKFLARENETGKMGTFETRFSVPDLGSEDSHPRLSSIVLSNQLEPLSSAVGSAGGDKKLLKEHPLVKDEKKLIPSITRVFRKDQDLYVYFEVYDPGAESRAKNPSLAASVSFFRGKAKAFESEPLRVTTLPKPKSNAVPVEFQIRLADFVPGSYVCQVNLIDELGRKFAFRRAPLVLLP